MAGGWQIPSRESSRGSTNCVTIIVVLGKIAHSDVKGNVSLCGRLNPEVFTDQVRRCCKLFKYIFHKESCYKEIAHFFVLSLCCPLRLSYLTLLAFVGFMVVLANPREDEKSHSHQTQSRQCLFQLRYSSYVINRDARPKSQVLDHRGSPTKWHLCCILETWVLPLLLQNTLSSDWSAHTTASRIQEVSQSVFFFSFFFLYPFIYLLNLFIRGCVGSSPPRAGSL